MDKLTLQLDAIAVEELGVQVIDLRVKKIDLPPEVSDSVDNRMRTERERLAKELRAQGNEVAEKIRATADKEKTIILADAYRQAEEIKGNGDAIATATYANAYSKDPEFYDFTRSLKAYQSTFGSKSDILLINPDSDFFKYLDDSNAKLVDEFKDTLSLPDGVDELLPPKALEVEMLRRKLIDSYLSSGYEFITPPLLELSETIGGEAHDEIKSHAFSFKDNLTEKFIYKA